MPDNKCGSPVLPAGWKLAFLFGRAKRSSEQTNLAENIGKRCENRTVRGTWSRASPDRHWLGTLLQRTLRKVGKLTGEAQRPEEVNCLL